MSNVPKNTRLGLLNLIRGENITRLNKPLTIVFGMIKSKSVEVFKKSLKVFAIKVKKKYQNLIITNKNPAIMGYIVFAFTFELSLT